jgi:hypothetical protein
VQRSTSIYLVCQRGVRSCTEKPSVRWSLRHRLQRAGTPEMSRSPPLQEPPCPRHGRFRDDHADPGAPRAALTSVARLCRNVARTVPPDETRARPGQHVAAIGDTVRPSLTRTSSAMRSSPHVRFASVIEPLQSDGNLRLAPRP